MALTYTDLKLWDDSQLIFLLEKMKPKRLLKVLQKWRLTQTLRGRKARDDDDPMDPENGAFSAA